MRKAFSFLTCLGTPEIPTPSSLIWFPFVGLCLGLLLSGIWIFLSLFFPMLVTSILVVLSDLFLTRMIHLDGLADASDGLIAHLSKQKRLQVMADPLLGSFGVISIVISLGLRWAALYSLKPSLLILPSVWMASRAVMALGIVLVPYARPSTGLAGVFIVGNKKQKVIVVLVCVISILLAGVILGFWKLIIGPLALMVGLVMAIVVMNLSRKKIDGFTGDILGAMGIVLETASLVIATLK